jgi:hypothetical protein
MTAILAGSLYASLYIAFKARDTGLRSLESVRKCEAAISLLKEDIASAAGPNGLLAGPFVGQRAADLAGDQGDSLTFCATATDSEADTGMGDIRKVEFACEASDDGRGVTLVRRVTANLLSPRTVEPRQETICRGVRSFQLRYFDGSAWQDTWDSTTQGNILPVAVEVTIEVDETAASSGSDAGYRVCRVVPVPCGQAGADTASTGESSTPP